MRTLKGAIRSKLLIAALLTSFHGFGLCFSVQSPSTTSSPILTASTPETDGEPQFDIGCVANPVIIPPKSDGEEWQCYYYGNAGSWSGGRKCFLPTGSSGLAISTDGLEWTKVAGKETGGSILTPSDSGWDCVQTGVGDVVRISDDELHMYYFGGDDEEIPMGPAGSIAGFRMRIGRAKSMDNGRTWKKDESYVLDYDASEGLFASWPRIVSSDSSPWLMFYHSFDGQKWRVFSAQSNDKGETWSRTGLVLEGGPSEDDFDFAGIGTRDIVSWRDGLLMIYEAVGKDGKHRFGAAFSKDSNTQFEKLNDGKPILEPGTGSLGDWTKQVIGTPYVVNMPDGSLRIYHCAKESPAAKMSIGVLESKTGDIGPDCWTAIDHEKKSDEKIQHLIN